MHQDVCLVKLPGNQNFAVITPGRVAYGLNASSVELRNFMQEEEALFLRRLSKNVRANQSSSVSLGVIPTFDCNLDCVYCYARGGESKEILPLEVGKAAIRGAALPQNRKRLKVSLVGGGEPLLYLALVKELTTYAKALYQRVELNVVTNGTFGEEALAWLLKNRVSVRVSYDGVRQNIQRPFANGEPSLKVVEQNIRRLIQGGAFVIAQCVVTKAGLGTMRRTVDIAASLGLRAIKFEPALVTAVSRATEKLEPDPKKYALALLDVNDINLSNPSVFLQYDRN